MGTCSPPTTEPSTMSISASSKRVPRHGLLLSRRVLHLNLRMVSSSSSSSKNARVAGGNESRISHPPPPRPPRPETSLPNLRPTVILSTTTVPATVYIPRSACLPRTPKVVSFSEDVFAALPARLRPQNDEREVEYHNKFTQDIWRESSNDLQCVSMFPTRPQDARIGHGYMQRQNERNSSSEVCYTPYASSSCLGTSFTSYCREQKHLEFSCPAFNDASIAEPEQYDRRREIDQESCRLKPLQDWIARNRRLLWMTGVVGFILVASSAITGAILWKLTTCK